MSEPWWPAATPIRRTLTTSGPDLLHRESLEEPLPPASLLILASILPRLPRYEDLNRVMNRLPGIKGEGRNRPRPWPISTDSWAGRRANSIICCTCSGNMAATGGRTAPGNLWDWRLWPWSWKTAGRGPVLRAGVKLRPHDPKSPKRLLQCQMSQKNWGQALKLMEQDQTIPARLWRWPRFISCGVNSRESRPCGEIPAGSGPGRLAALLVRACRGEQNYPEARRPCLTGRQGSRADYLMEKARTLEGMGDKGRGRGLPGNHRH